MKPLYIFDLDGTLALIDHRLHFIVPPHCPVATDKKNATIRVLCCGNVARCRHNMPPGDRR